MKAGKLMMPWKWLGMLLLCALVTAGTEATACLRPPRGLTHWWPGDGNAHDIVGGVTGTLQGGATFAQGMVGQAFLLDGINGWINIPHDPSLNFGEGDFTVELWVKFANLSPEQVIIEKYIETENLETRKGWCLTKMPGNHLRFGGPGKAWFIDVYLPQALVLDTWYHAAVTRQGNLFTLYWNGTMLGKGEGAANLDSSASLKIGHRGNPVDTPGSVDTRNFYLNGSVDEVSLYSRSLNAGEIQVIFQAGARGKCKNALPVMPSPITPLLLSD
jgi:hypothetical protein